MRELFRLEGLATSTQLISKVRKNMGQASKKLHGEIKFAIQKTYNSPYNIDSALSELASSTKITGKNVIENDLNYRYSFKDLSKYYHSRFIGNINPGAKRKGWVHKVLVKRGSPKIVYGKQHRGGFIPRDSSGKAVSFGKFGSQMFERKTSRRYPVRLLLGPHLGHMIFHVLEHDPRVKKARDNMAEEVFKNIKFFEK